MRAAIVEAEKARGTTGDNPWVGSVIVDPGGEIVARGHTQGPGEDHAEIGAIGDARVRGVDLARATLYSTLEPCAFHGRTPACAHAIVAAGFRRVVTGIRDPNPRVDGAGVQILRDGGVEVIEDVCAREISIQIGPWILLYHPHEPLRRARAMRGRSRDDMARVLCEHYGVERALVEPIVDRARRRTAR